jgi:hypothetical protein
VTRGREDDGLARQRANVLDLDLKVALARWTGSGSMASAIVPATRARGLRSLRRFAAVAAESLAEVGHVEKTSMRSPLRSSGMSTELLASNSLITHERARPPHIAARTDG